MRKSILLLASLAVAAALAAVPHYTNTFSSGGVTYSQLGGVKASNYVATAIDASLLAKTNSAKEVIAKSVADYVSHYGEHYLKDISPSTIGYYFRLMSDSATTPVLAAFDGWTICQFSKTGDSWRFFALGSEYSVSSSGSVTTNSIVAKADEFTPWVFSGETAGYGNLSVVIVSVYEGAAFDYKLYNGGTFIAGLTDSSDSLTVANFITIDATKRITATRKRVLRTGDAATLEQLSTKQDKLPISEESDDLYDIGTAFAMYAERDGIGNSIHETYVSNMSLAQQLQYKQNILDARQLAVVNGGPYQPLGEGSEPAFDTWRTNDNQVALGNSSTVSAAKGMAIGLKTTTGRTTIAAGSSSIAFGIGAQTAPAGAASVALGANATASAANAVQIGAGNNTVASTLKFMGTTVVDADGRIPLSTHSAQVVDSISAVNAWQNYWSGDDVRLTVTNYYGSVDIPSLYLEQKMPADDDHDDSWFKIVWDERTRWNRFIATWDVFTNNVADRAWGVYDSSTGEYSPDGLLQLTQEQIMIASGMSWQKTVTSGGCAVWVLKSNTPTMLTGEDESGFFKIEDSDGNALFEIVKGDKRIVGATATDVSFSDGSLRVVYNSQSAEHPSLQVCDDLKTADWQEESELTIATVSWSGSSGEWIATITPVGARQSLFAKASYEAGGNTYIKNHVASSLDKVVVGGVEYSVSVETVNGKKLLVLQ